jgi:hypothetical protein
MTIASVSPGAGRVENFTGETVRMDSQRLKHVRILAVSMS